MSELPSDQAARERFTRDWGVNLAIVANAGSGKTTAISRRLAAMALSPGGAALLERTAVVTFTKKAASQIGRRARKVLVEELASSGASAMDPLSRLDRVFFGTIHSFCILLARRHGSAIGVHLNPTLVEEEDDAPWEEFIEQDPMQFSSLDPGQIDAFLRHAALDDLFDLAKNLNLGDARRLEAVRVAPRPPAPPAQALAAIEAAQARKGSASLALARNQALARRWAERFASGGGRLPIARPEGKAAGIEGLYQAYFAPLKGWLAAAGGVLAAELSLRYRAWRQERGVQTYADQVDTALAVLGDAVMLDRIREEGWRVVLDEAQDTDASQFSVLVEITRPAGSVRGSWPGAGEGPRPGHFCMVGDAQQGIYSSRADIRNFQRHVDAFARADGGERLAFDVTFRAPERVIGMLNRTLPAAFGPTRPYNFGLPAEPGAQAPRLQVDYETLVAGPANAQGSAWLLRLPPSGVAGRQGAGDRRLAHEARQLARLLRVGGPAAVGAATWGDICILAPRRDWLPIIRGEFEAEHVRTALQMRRNRSGDNPVYAWLSGLLAVLCDPENTFEWAGVLREVFGVSDALIERAVRRPGGLQWDEPGDHPEPIQRALEALAPFIGRVDLEGESLGRFAADLCQACGLAWKADAADPDGNLSDELSRLLAQADSLGIGGSGPRQWLASLLDGLEQMRASGRPSPGAVNLITSHSSKGLEWPVVIPLGLWRKMGRREPHGLRLVSERSGAQRVVFDTADMGAEAKESREREWRREQVRLLYVMLTRAKSALVIPWPEDAVSEPDSLADFWGPPPEFLELELAPPVEPRPLGAPAAGPVEPEAVATPLRTLPSFPERVLPHRLAREPDLARGARHEASAEAPAPSKDATDPLDYGTWWHELLEGVPWSGDDAAVALHARDGLARAADRGFGERAGQEWERLLLSGPWSVLRDKRWTALAELGVFAPMEPGRWIDGVMDLVLHDPAAREVWIVDWKTNRRLAGEDDATLLGRLAQEYAPQLEAYGRCAGSFFPGCAVKLWVYATAAGQWTEIGPGRA